MNKRNYNFILYLISFTIVIIITVQAYWIYKEYQINKQNLINNVQLSLDNSVETYFANLTKTGIITFTSIDSTNSKKRTDTIFIKKERGYRLKRKIDSTLLKISKSDSNKPLLIKNRKEDFFPFFTPNRRIPKSIDSLISKVFISISRDSLDLAKLNHYLKKELKRKHINIKYGFKFVNFRRDFRDQKPTINKFNLKQLPKKHLVTVSRSTFLPHRSRLELWFTNESKIVLKKSLFSISLSLLLAIAIISSILYLLKTIYKQKQLSEIKNDLISNITHEFKTPIATVSTALEAMQNFNALNEKEKTENYLKMASKQLNKLNFMVEKLLDTATLKHNELILQKKKVNVISILNEVTEKYQLLDTSKSINLISDSEKIMITLDEFHFENAIGNLIDNAIKYGGKKINCSVQNKQKTVQILIEDNGNGIPKAQKNKVFEQFYRVPKGNVHNVKGFGIGLYYTKQIIEKHGGTIELNFPKNNLTQFKISLPND
ncbi:MAG: sensor histidine kinase [Lutibacter sp.]